MKSAFTASIAVIIPAYNAMRYLPAALNSVLRQTYQNFEVVIVNDGSQDNLEAWYTQLSPPLRSRVKLVSQPNQGIASARNAGLACTQSPYVAFLDADDIWLPHKLARQIEYLRARPAVSLVYSWAATIDEHSRPMGHLYAGRAPQQIWSDLVVSNMISTASAVMLRRECLAAVGDFDATLRSYVEDKDLWLRIARAHSVQMLPEVLIYKRRHATNTSKQWQAMEMASERVLQKAFAHPPEHLKACQLERLKPPSYGNTYLKLAWKPLQTDKAEIKIALSYWLKAVTCCPALIFSKASLKLLAVMVSIALWGTGCYRQSLQLLSRFRKLRSKRKIAPLQTSLQTSKPPSLQTLIAQNAIAQNVNPQNSPQIRP
jgi:glycosyltransferase involved in cell wall biosynthesis